MVDAGQQCRNVCGLPESTEGEALRTTNGDLGPRAGPPRRGGARVPGGAGLGHTTGEPAGLQPGLQRRQGDQGFGE